MQFFLKIVHFPIVRSNYCTRWRYNFKGPSQDGERPVFSKIKHRSSLFNDDLSNEPNFGRIHLAGQYL
jgi:hypothetical protein